MAMITPNQMTARCPRHRHCRADAIANTIEKADLSPRIANMPASVQMLRMSAPLKPSASFTTASQSMSPCERRRLG